MPLIYCNYIFCDPSQSFNLSKKIEANCIIDVLNTQKKKQIFYSFQETLHILSLKKKHARQCGVCTITSKDSIFSATFYVKMFYSAHHFFHINVTQRKDKLALTIAESEASRY